MHSHPIALAVALLVTLLPDEGRAQDAISLRTRSVEIPVETESIGAAAIEGVMLWVTRDDGGTWQPHPRIHHGAGPIRYEAPEDGRYGFRMVARDRAGRIQEPPQPGDLPDATCVIDTTPPLLELLSPEPGDRVYAGSELVIRWSASDVLLDELPIEIEVRRSPSHPWSSILEERRFPAEGQTQWWPPYVDGVFQLRVIATDRVGNRSERILDRPIEVVPFDAFRESSLLAAETTTRFHRFPVFYRSPRFRPDEIGRVEIWLRRGFGSWSVRLDPDRRSPYHFVAEEEGEHDLYVRAVDRNGVEDRPAPESDTPGDLRILVDTLPPLVELQIEDGASFRVHRGGDPIALRYRIDETDPSSHGARIEASLDGGVSWRGVAEIEDSAAGEGLLEWTPPMIETDELSLRIVARDRAGNRAVRLAPTRLRLINPRADREDLVARHHRRALVLADRGDLHSLEQAREELLLVLEVAPEEATVWHDRGVLETRLAEHAAALKSYRRALDLRPGDLHLTFSLVQGHLNLHRVAPDREAAEAEGSSLETARVLLRSIDKVSIYEDPNFRELLQRYRLLEDGLR